MSAADKEKYLELRERLGKSFDKVVELEVRVQILNCIMPELADFAAAVAKEARVAVREKIETLPRYFSDYEYDSGSFMREHKAGDYLDRDVVLAAVEGTS